MIELYGDAVCFTYQMKIPDGTSFQQFSEAFVESLRVSPVQQVAAKLAQELKEFYFGLKVACVSPKISNFPWRHSSKTHH